MDERLTGWDRYRNPYSEPEKCGLRWVGSIEYSSGHYEFDTRMVWQRLDNGAYVTARDSGCSCPMPFEDYESVQALEPLSLDRLDAEFREECASEWSHFDKDEARQALAAIRRNVDDRGVG